MEYNGMKQSFIQCTLGIGPGDSGSPILNESNEVLGMVAYRSRNNAGTVEQNFCYGIPSSRIGSAVN
jgi:S1-C subfamily serine protease